MHDNLDKESNPTSNSPGENHLTSKLVPAALPADHVVPNFAAMTEEQFEFLDYNGKPSNHLLLPPDYDLSQVQVAGNVDLDLSEAVRRQRMRPSLRTLEAACFDVDKVALEQALTSAITDHWQGYVDPENPASCAIERHVLLSQRVWRYLEQRGHSVAPESVAERLELLTLPGAHMIEVVMSPFDPPQHFVLTPDHTRATGLILTDPRYFSDRADFPSEYRTADVVRGREIIVDQDKQSPLYYCLPEGLLVDLVVDKARQIAGSRPMLTRIVVGPKKYAYKWSSRPVEQRGAEAVGQVLEETVVLPPLDGVRTAPETVALQSQYFAFTPGKQSAVQKQFSERRRKQHSYVLERTAASVGFPTYGDILVWKSTRGDDEASLLAGQREKNDIYAAELTRSPADVYRDNLTYCQGRPSGELEGESLPQNYDGILLLNVLPDVASAQTGQTQAENVKQFLTENYMRLKQHAKLVVRDHVIPAWPEKVLVELDTFPRKPGDRLTDVSDATYFEHYARAAYEEQGIAFEKHSETESHVRYLVDRSEAIKIPWVVYFRDKNEFDKPYGVLERSDYHQLASSFRAGEVRARPIHSDYVRDNIFSRVKTYTPEGEWLGYPPNQFELTLQKTPFDAGVAVRPLRSERIETATYLKKSYFVRTTTGEGSEVRELVERKSPEVYFAYPVFEIDNEPYLLAKENYPRGIPNFFLSSEVNKQSLRDFPLNGVMNSEYISEGIAAVRRDDESIGDVLTRTLQERCHIPADDIPSLEQLQASSMRLSIPSSATINEKRWSTFIPVSPTAYVKFLEEGYSGLPSSGAVRPFKVKDIVANFDGNPIVGNELVNAAYRYLLDRNIALPEWKRDIKLSCVELPEKFQASLPALFAETRKQAENPWREVFEPPVGVNPFFELWRVHFAEYDSQGNVLTDEAGNPAVLTLEAATTAEERGLTGNTIPVLPVVNTPDGLFVALEMRDDLPLFQNEFGLSKVLCVPAFRVPVDIEPGDRLRAAQNFVVDAMQRMHGTTIARPQTFGDELYVAPGLSNERVYPMLAEVDVSQLDNSDLHLVSFDEIKSDLSSFLCGHTQTMFHLGGHALQQFQQE
jgi:hypothetical protein